MAPADTAATQFTHVLCCQGRAASVTLMLACVLPPPGGEGRQLPPLPPSLSAVSLPFEGRGKKKKTSKDRTLKRRRKKKRGKRKNERKKLGMRERCVEERKTCFILFVCLSCNNSVICCSGRNCLLCSCLPSPALLQKDDKNNLLLGGYVVS